MTTKGTRQENHQSGGPFNSIPAPSAGSYVLTAGRALCVYVKWEDVAGTAAVNDIAGNTWVPKTKQQIAGPQPAWEQWFYCTSVLGSGVEVITFDCPDGSNYPDIVVLEFIPDGVVAFLDEGLGAQAAGVPPTTAAFNAGQFAVYGCAEYAGTTATPGSGWFEQTDSAANGTHVFDRVDSPGGTIVGNCTIGASVESASAALSFTDTVSTSPLLYTDSSYRRNRPGRGPYSRGAYERSDAVANVIVIVPPPAPYVPPDGVEDSRRNRPGFGPYSLGYYSRPRYDAITSVATQTLNAAAIAHSIGTGQLVASQQLSAIVNGIAIGAASASASALLSVVAQSIAIGAANFVGTSLVLVTGSAIGVAIGTGLVQSQLTLSAVAQAITEVQGQFVGQSTLQAIAQAIAETTGTFASGIQGIVQAAAIGVAIGSASAAPALVISAAAQANVETSARAIAQQLLAGTVIGHADSTATVNAAVIIGANASAIAAAVARAVVNSASAGITIPNVRIFTIAPDVRIVQIDTSDRTIN